MISRELKRRKIEIEVVRIVPAEKYVGEAAAAASRDRGVAD